jgi:HD-GYP domain-containing protein (c-di-GMP phosphodiesterase class II)
MVRVRRLHAWYLVETALYYQNVGGGYSELKAAGRKLDDIVRDPVNLPNRLFVNDEDKAAAIKEMQAGVAKSIREQARSGDVKGIKENLVGVVGDCLTDPRSGNLEGLSESVNTLAQECAGSPHILRNMAVLSSTDYTTALHSVNVMALAMGFCIKHKMPETKVREIGVAALLHDVGKSEVDLGILQADRKLSQAEFAKMKAHTTLGHKILLECGIRSEITCKVALQHHEKLDGQGYPKGLTNIPFESRLVAVIDCYEALTADERPYRTAMRPIGALSILKEEVESGKLDRAVFEKFVQSLA